MAEAFNYAEKLTTHRYKETRDVLTSIAYRKYEPPYLFSELEECSSGLVPHLKAMILRGRFVVPEEGRGGAYRFYIDVDGVRIWLFPDRFFFKTGDMDMMRLAFNPDTTKNKKEKRAASIYIPDTTEPGSFTNIVVDEQVGKDFRRFFPGRLKRQGNNEECKRFFAILQEGLRHVLAYTPAPAIEIPFEQELEAVFDDFQT